MSNVVAAVLYSGGTKVHKFYKGRYIASYESLSVFEVQLGRSWYFKMH
jgi:hypothetical protein